MVYLFGLGVKKGDGYRIIRVFFLKAIFKDQGCAHDFSTSQCQTEEIRTSLSCKGQGLNTHMLIEIEDGGAAVEEGKKERKKNLIRLSRDLGFSFLTLPSDLGETTLEACLGGGEPFLNP